MSQPALSQWLTDLEKVVDRTLINRKRRQLSLTAEGEVLRAHAARILGDVHRTHTDFQATRSGLQGRLQVGTGFARVLFPKAIARLHRQTPGIFFVVVEAALPQLLEKMAKREVDLIICALSAEALRSGFAHEALMPNCVQVVARKGHPLAKARRPQWDEAVKYPWILPPVGAFNRTNFDNVLAANNLSPPSPCIEANSSTRFQLLMSDANYLSILSAAEVELYRPLGVIEKIGLTPIIQTPDIGAVWDKDRAGPILQHFLDALRDEARAALTVK